MKQYYIDSNIKDVSKWIVNITNNVFNDELAREIAREFAKRAREKLKASGKFFKTDISKYVQSIRAKKVGNQNLYRIYAGYGGDKQLKDDMYYLEFGTGLAGQRSPHPEANLIGWYYNGKDGNAHKVDWAFVRDSEYGNADAFITSNDKSNITNKKGQQIVRTAGVTPIRYFYDTMREFDDIVTTVIRRMK